MVSFSCEVCGDVVTKKKLDQHRNQCRGASFSCLDCMVHFRGTDYRSHTSCITEDQKYQGALYKPKPSKVEKRKSVKISEPKNPGTIVARAAYVEDASDVEIPPAAPSPPPAASAQPVQPPSAVNVFDFLVAENSPNASKASLGGSREQMAMKKEAQSIFSYSSTSKQSIKAEYAGGEDFLLEGGYQEHGFTYGSEPVKPSHTLDSNASLVSFDFTTPAAKVTKPRGDRTDSTVHSRTDSGATIEKKRKRGSPEALDLSNVQAKANRRRQQADDTPMADAPPSSADTPSLAHSGLTGGLNRLLSDPNPPFPPTPEYSDEKEEAREMERKNRYSYTEHPASPLKRSRHSKDDNSVAGSGAGLSIKGRAGRIMSMVGGASSSGRRFSVLNPAALQNKETALVKARPRTNSPEDDHQSTREGRRREKRKVKVRRGGSVRSSSRHGSSTYTQSYAGEQPGSLITSNTSRRRRGSNDSPEARKRKVKAIQYHHADPTVSDSDSEADHPHRRVTGTSHPRPRGGGGGGGGSLNNANPAELVVYGEEERLKLRADSFLSYVTKGPDSSRGCSINKALKRWHRDGAGTRTGSVVADDDGGGDGGHRKDDEQKELWRALRLRKNERGEVVLFF